jgi:hypothetical protein
MVASQIVQPSAEALAELDRRVQAHLDENNIPGGLVAVAPRGFWNLVSLAPLR